jgi:hypothetical protein
MQQLNVNIAASQPPARRKSAASRAEFTTDAIGGSKVVAKQTKKGA